LTWRTAAVKNNRMTRAFVRGFGLYTLALLASGCVGGQTYDDGSDDVRRGGPSPGADSGAGGGPAGPNSQGGGAGEPEPGPSEPEPAPGMTEPEPGPSDPSPDGGGSLTCQERWNEVSAEVQTFANGADRSCQTDDDCVPVESQPRCLAGCGIAGLFSTQGAAAVEAKIDELDETLCADYEEEGCIPMPLPCTPPLPEVPHCSEGTCGSVDTETQCSVDRAAAANQINVAVAEIDRSCTADADCQVIDALSCADPCGRLVLGNATSIEEVPALLEAACESFDALGCPAPEEECVLIDPARDNYCDAGQCVFGVRPSSDCYGPEMNVELAYSGTIDGCPCEDLGSLCSGGVALICSNGAWQAVEDGPCEPGLIEQGCHGRVNSSATCVELFDNCVQLDTGAYCGVGRRTALCDGGELVETSGDCYQDDSFCVELANGLYCTGTAGSGPISSEACVDRGGEVVANDTETLRTECPDGRATLASVEGCGSDCFCCGFAP
jgi:hypothetical protein